VEWEMLEMSSVAAPAILPSIVTPSAVECAAGQHPVVLFVQDTTELDYTHHPTKEGLGLIGDGNGQGLLLHSTLDLVHDETPTALGPGECLRPCERGYRRSVNRSATLGHGQEARSGNDPSANVSLIAYALPVRVQLQLE
jgi:hypothetical protein